MEAMTQEQQPPEVRFLLGQISDAEFRAEVCQDPEIREIVNTFGFDHYKARMFEAMARGYLKILRERYQARQLLSPGHLLETINAINQVYLEQYGLGGAPNVR